MEPKVGGSKHFSHRYFWGKEKRDLGMGFELWSSAKVKTLSHIYFI
jgi:hypothetical protein